MKTAAKPTGLRYWMLRVLQECDNVAADFQAGPVHDLRVSLRRCRSLADGMIEVDPANEWKAMKKSGKALFQSLGALRDIQIMMEWLDKLEAANKTVDPHAGAGPKENFSAASSAEPAVEQSIASVADALTSILKQREAEQKSKAHVALEEFDRKQWREWSRSLPLRAARIRPGSPVFKHLALERWTSAKELHTRAMRSRSQIALHTLRMGIKRFRYIVENFLPEEHRLWSGDLKHLQDLLGEVHDLDVLWATAKSCQVFQDERSRNAWHERILKERTRRIEEYRQRTVGRGSLWDQWRTGLPQGKQIHEIATARMKLWAKVLDPDFPHSERIARLALQLYDGLVAAGLLGKKAVEDGSDARASLLLAALLHDVGKAKGSKGHHKESRELIKKQGTPLGWKAENMTRAALVARFHCGALPRRSHKALRDLVPGEQKLVIWLSAILRLANALDAQHDGRIRRLKIQSAEPIRQRTNGFLRKAPIMGKNGTLVIAAEGYADGSATAQAVAAERYLLETVLHRPVIVKPASSLRSGGAGMRRGLKT